MLKGRDLIRLIPRLADAVVIPSVPLVIPKQTAISLSLVLALFLSLSLSIRYLICLIPRLADAVVIHSVFLVIPRHRAAPGQGFGFQKLEFRV